MANGNLDGAEFETKVDYGKSGVFIQGHSVGEIGQNEGTVICKSLGFENLEKIIGANEIDFDEEVQLAQYTYTCDGSEARLEDCQEKHHGYYSNLKPMSVKCGEHDKLGKTNFIKWGDYILCRMDNCIYCLYFNKSEVN